MELYKKIEFENEIVYCFKDEQGNIYKIGISGDDLKLSEAEKIKKAKSIAENNS